MPCDAEPSSKFLTCQRWNWTKSPSSLIFLVVVCPRSRRRRRKAHSLTSRDGSHYKMLQPTKVVSYTWKLQRAQNVQNRIPRSTLSPVVAALLYTCQRSCESGVLCVTIGSRSLWLDNIYIFFYIKIYMNYSICLNFNLYSIFHSIFRNNDADSIYHNNSKCKEISHDTLFWKDCTKLWFDKIVNDVRKQHWKY